MPSPWPYEAHAVAVLPEPGRDVEHDLLRRTELRAHDCARRGNAVKELGRGVDDDDLVRDVGVGGKSWTDVLEEVVRASHARIGGAEEDDVAGLSHAGSNAKSRVVWILLATFGRGLMPMLYRRSNGKLATRQHILLPLAFIPSTSLAR